MVYVIAQSVERDILNSTIKAKVKSRRSIQCSWFKLLLENTEAFRLSRSASLHLEGDDGITYLNQEINFGLMLTLPIGER